MIRVLVARHLPAAWALAVMLALGGSPAWTKDLGTLGGTWPVAEPDLLAEIEARLRRDGELGRDGAHGGGSPRPRARAGWRSRRLRPASRRRRDGKRGRSIRRSVVTVARTFSDAWTARLVAAAGNADRTRLDHATLTRDVLFVDGQARGGARLGARGRRAAREDRAAGRASAGPDAPARPALLLRPRRAACRPVRAFAPHPRCWRTATRWPSATSRHGKGSLLAPAGYG